MAFAVLSGCASLVVLAELGYRFATTRSFKILPTYFEPDSVLRYRLNRNRPDFHSGFRGEGPPADRAGGTLVVCLGGSTTIGHGVAADSAWPHLTQDSLRAAGVRSWVLNAGVNGYGSRQLLRRFQTEVAPIGPDYIVVFEGWNRVGTLVDPEAFTPFSQGLVARIVTKLAPYSLLIRDAAAPFARRAVVRVGQWRPDRFEEVWEADMDSLVRQIAAHGIRPMVVVYPSLYHDGMTAGDLEAYAAKGWLGRRYDPGMVAEINEKHAALRRIAMARGAGLIDVEGALDTIRGQPRRALFLDEWHLSKTGNRMVARMVAAALLADLSDRRRPPASLTASMVSLPVRYLELTNR